MLKSRKIWFLFQFSVLLSAPIHASNQHCPGQFGPKSEHVLLVERLEKMGLEKYWSRFNGATPRMKNNTTGRDILDDPVIKDEMHLPVEFALLAALGGLDLPARTSSWDMARYIQAKVQGGYQLSPESYHYINAKLDQKTNNDFIRATAADCLWGNTSIQAEMLVEYALNDPAEIVREKAQAAKKYLETASRKAVE